MNTNRIPTRRGSPWIVRGSALTRRFAQEKSGAIAVVFAISLLPVLALVGAAVDYARATAAYSRFVRAADASALLAVNEAITQIAKGKSDSAAFSSASQLGATYYTNQVGPLGGKPTIALTRSSATITAKTTSQGISQNAFAVFLGSEITLGVDAVASATLPSFVDISILVDVSGSMSIGADQAAIDTLNAQLGCAFACHDGAPVKGTKLDAYEWALSKGIKLRTQAVNTGLVSFLDWLAVQPGAKTYNRVALGSFSDTVTMLANYTTNYDVVKSDLPQTTSAASEFTGATHFTEIMPLVTTAIGSAGNGGTAAQAKKLLIIATDGVQDPNRTWTYDASLRPKVAPFDPASCDAAKRAGVIIGVIHTPYVPLKDDWGYAATLGQPSSLGGSGTRGDDVAPQLAKCASNGLYFQASASDIGSSFQAIFTAISPVRLTQ
jgi:Flp pilus assembly protein TadG